MRHFVCLAFGLALIPAQLLAAPVSLDCRLTVQKTGATQKFEVQLNEETESASYPHPFNAGEVVRYRAFFTPGKVTFGDSTFTIDRTTLAFERRNTFFGEYKGTDFGQCAVMKVKRAF